ncbi:verprolin [Aplysia californica]|uniref:Verprolin n=1 Tax=Aplysia californica TaxID=6500 RepID=A0ABM1VRW0_APLCA|nr:verprolin [Aplysia californica]
MMKNLREDLHEERAKKPRQIQESLEDVGAELQQMRSKLQQLMAEIQGKEQTIDNLEAELRDFRQAGQSRDKDVEEMQSLVRRLEEENKDLRENLEDIRNTLASELAQENGEQEQSLRRTKSAKSLQEELAEAVKAKQDGSYGRSRTPNPFLSKSLSQLEKRPASAPPLPAEPGKTQQRGKYGGWFFNLPDKAATEGSDRLQSLISKYRSHSEKTEQQQQLQQPRVVKPLPGFVASKIVSKNRFGSGGSTTPKAPMRRTSDPTSPSETPISPLAKQDGDTPTPIMSSRPAKKLPPPPPPPKPTSSSHALKSPFMQTLSSESAKVTSTSSSTTPTRQQPQTPLRASSNTSPLSSLRASSIPVPRPASPAIPASPANGTPPSRSLSSSGLGHSASSAEALNDSSEQKDINALIQKLTLFDEMAAF